MEIKFYSTLPEEAAAVRTEVFVEEQGFINEMDDIDSYAEHIVAFDGDKPVGTCRFFKDDKTENDYIAGRIAVRKEYRGRDIGTAESGGKGSKGKGRNPGCSSRAGQSKGIL